MASNDPHRLMWAEACALVERAERLQRRFFELNRSRQSRAVWEPPVDIFETGDALWIIAALPGVGPEDMEVILEDNVLILAGRRKFPLELRHATIRRLELPHGRFERRITLPARRWEVAQREATCGCLVVRLYHEL